MNLAELKSLKEKITQGKWETHPAMHEDGKTYVHSVTGLVCASCRTNDAYLISISPDLLSDLIELKEWKEEMRAKIEDLTLHPKMYIEDLEPSKARKLLAPYLVACSDILSLLNKER